MTLESLILVDEVAAFCVGVLAGAGRFRLAALTLLAGAYVMLVAAQHVVTRRDAPPRADRGLALAAETR